MCPWPYLRPKVGAIDASRNSSSAGAGTIFATGILRGASFQTRIGARPGSRTGSLFIQPPGIPGSAGFSRTQVFSKSTSLGTSLATCTFQRRGSWRRWVFPGACPLKFGQRGKFALKIGPDWGIFLRATKRGKDSLFCELPHTHKTRGSYGQWPILGIDFSAKQASNRGIESWGFGGFISPKFFSIFLRIFFTYFSGGNFSNFFLEFFFGFFSIRGVL